MPYDPIPADEMLTRLIQKHADAIDARIKADDRATVAAVAARTGERLGDEALRCDVDEAEALVRAGVIGRVALVGKRIYCIVIRAVYEEAMELANAELRRMNMARQESADDARISRAIDARAA